MRIAIAALLLLTACSQQASDESMAAGSALEEAAVARGLVADPSAVPLTGLFARDADRLCLRAGDDESAIIGISIDYGEGNGCSARGTARRTGAGLAIDFGEACRFDAGYDGDGPLPRRAARRLRRTVSRKRVACRDGDRAVEPFAGRSRRLSRPARAVSLRRNRSSAVLTFT